jgi:hypothetical protein
LKNSVFTLLAAALLSLILLPGLARDESSTASAAVAVAADEQVAVTAPPPVATTVAGEMPVVGRAVDVEAAEAAGVSLDVLRIALGAVQCGVSSGDFEAPPTLTLIDYSRPSVEPRLWVFDLASGRILFKELVAHGRNTGENMATRFSDNMNSHQSSLGLFVTGDTYVGNNGYSLRLDGLEPGFNAHARDRAVVMHGAPYVNAALAASQGRIGRSWGCPALREAVARDVIDTIRGGGVIFSYYPDQDWLTASKFVNCGVGIGGRTTVTN